MDSTTAIPAAARWLGFAGLLPFAAAAVAALVPGMPLHGYALPALLAYGAAILSFLGGIRWGLAMTALPPGTTAALPPGTVSASPPDVMALRLGFSVLPSLVGWLALLLPPGQGLLLLALGFAAMLVADQRIGFAPAWYPRLRLPLSLGALVALLLGLLA